MTFNVNNEHILFQLEEYMFTSKNISSLIKVNNIEKPSLKKWKSKESDSTLFTPTNKDKLFWCLYILINGRETYEILNKNDFYKIESKNKIEYIEKLRAIKSTLKEKKMRRSLIEADILNERISFISLEAICVIYDINVILIKNKSFIEINKGGKFVGILIYENKCFSIKETYPKNYVEFIRNKYYEIISITKPIKAISAYTIQELYEICFKFEIDIKNGTRKKTKQHIYNEIKNLLLLDEI